MSGTSAEQYSKSDSDIRIANENRSKRTCENTLHTITLTMKILGDPGDIDYKLTSLEGEIGRDRNLEVFEYKRECKDIRYFLYD